MYIPFHHQSLLDDIWQNTLAETFLDQDNTYEIKYILVRGNEKLVKREPNIKKRNEIYILELNLNENF